MILTLPGAIVVGVAFTGSIVWCVMLLRVTPRGVRIRTSAVALYFAATVICAAAASKLLLDIEASSPYSGGGDFDRYYHQTVGELWPLAAPLGAAMGAVCAWANLALAKLAVDSIRRVIVRTAFIALADVALAGVVLVFTSLAIRPERQFIATFVIAAALAIGATAPWPFGFAGRSARVPEIVEPPASDPDLPPDVARKRRGYFGEPRRD